jgi:hypothetical protein
MNSSFKDYKIGQNILCLINGKEKRHRISFIEDNSVTAFEYSCGWKELTIPKKDIIKILNNGSTWVNLPNGTQSKKRHEEFVQADMMTELALKADEAYDKLGPIEIGDKVGGQYSRDGDVLGVVRNIFTVKTHNFGFIKRYIVETEQGIRHYMYETDIFKIDNGNPKWVQ